MAQASPEGATAEGLDRGDHGSDANTRRQVLDDLAGRENTYHRHRLETEAGVFNLLHSLMGGILLFIVALIAAQQATKFDTQILRVLLNSRKFKPRYDPMKWKATEIRIRCDV